MLIKDLIEQLQKFKPTDRALIVYNCNFSDDVRDVLEDMSADQGEAKVIITNIP